MNFDALELNDTTFDEEVRNSPVPILVDFWAAWCSPCKMIAPLMSDIAQEYRGRIKVASLNVEENVRTTTRYGIRGLPVVLLFKGGQVKENFIGLILRDQIVEALNRWL